MSDETKEATQVNIIELLKISFDRGLAVVILIGIWNFGMNIGKEWVNAQERMIEAIARADSISSERSAAFLETYSGNVALFNQRVTEFMDRAENRNTELLIILNELINQIKK